MAYVEGSELGDEIGRGPLAIHRRTESRKPKSYSLVS